MNLKQIAKQVPQHMVDTTGLLAYTNAIFAFNESVFVRMTAEESRGNRLWISGASYLGLGWVYAKGRDLWMNKWKVTQESKKMKKWFGELSYNITANAIIIPILYSINGVTEPESWATGLGVATAFSPIVGTVAGYSIELFRELSGMKPMNYEPKYKSVEKMGRLPGVVRAGLLATSIAGGVGAVEAIYKAVPDSWAKRQSSIEEIVNAS